MKKIIYGFLLSFTLIFTACTHGKKDCCTKDGKCEMKKEQGGKEGGKGCCGEGEGPASVPSVWFIEPKDGDVVKSEFKVVFGVSGFRVHPAGEMHPETGHHHLLINRDEILKGQVVPMDDKHMHFGKGQTETMVKLPKGKHKLTMQFADGAHISYGKDMSATIHVEVK